MKIKKKRKRITLGYALIMVVLILLALVILFPFLNALALSFMPSHEVARHPAALFPYGFSLDNYSIIFKEKGLLYAYRNTLFLVVGGWVYGMSICTMMAYAFSQKFPGKKFFLLMIMFTMYFGGGIVPMYLQLKDFNLIGHLYTIILIGGVNTWSILVMKNSFESVPQALTEAAKMDGANDLYIFVRVMLPLQKPMLATFTLFSVVGSWNEWFWPGLILFDSEKRPLMSYLRDIVVVANNALKNPSMAAYYQASSIGVRFAAIFCTMLPIMCFYPFVQKHFAKGMMVGAVKL